MKKSLKNLLIFTVTLFVFSGIVMLFGAIAILQHWPWASPILILGIGLNLLSFIIGGITYLKNK